MDLETAEERRDACAEMQFEYNGDHHYWDYAQWIAEILHNALEHVEGLVGVGNAAAPLRQLVEPVAAIEGIEHATWREVMEDVFSAGTVWPVGQRFQCALQYGMFGVTPAAIATADRAEWIEHLVADVSAFASRSDVRSLETSDNPIIRIANLAASRYALDTVRGEVDTLSMAILGRVSEGRVRNLMSGADAQLERGPNGGVMAVSALAWLMKRKEFLRSIWADEDKDETEETNLPVDLEKIIFVPVARDGSMFGPDLKRGGRYQIGAKGEEQHFDTFYEALESLNAMSTPRWRRPNELGHWGIVSGVSWQRIARP
ncbi:hypothetical protein [Maritimibacter sp. DP1N21-5]|uniref:hypothetical protein n=1 Tax=Maritimibacter sp. DP1N21-5 TaxID=2836867 RepID=UPI001C46671E|nr:hypothetical protein [Maritimibacter sp. DP1N21-5]MBV7410861.1 hypothetical protein [Maritimibacter sp. DP1N21-5]